MIVLGFSISSVVASHAPPPKLLPLSLDCDSSQPPLHLDLHRQDQEEDFLFPVPLSRLGSSLPALHRVYFILALCFTLALS